MSAIIDHQRDMHDFKHVCDVLPFVKRVHVCPNTGRKLLENNNGTLEEYLERKKDVGQEY